MEITLTRDQEAFIRRATESGRFARIEDAVTEALLLWEDRETRRAAFIASLDAADAAFDRGEGLQITPETMDAIASDVKRQGRERLLAQRRSST